MLAISIDNEFTPHGADSYMLGFGAPVGPNPAPILCIALPFNTLPIIPPIANPFADDLNPASDRLTICPDCLLFNSSAAAILANAAGVRFVSFEGTTAECTP